MTIYKRGNTWWVNCWRDGKHIQRSTKTSNRRAAEQIAAKLEVDLATGQAGMLKPAPIPLFVDFVERFRKEMHARHRAKPKTISYYDNGLNRLLEFAPWRNLGLDRIQESLIAQYILQRSTATKKTAKKKKAPLLAVATINRELEVLRRLLRIANEWKIIPSVPKISRQPGEIQRERILDHAEEQAYLAATDSLLSDVATIILETGMRPEEVFRMSWPNVHFQPAERARYGYIANPFGKTKYARRNVPMTQRVLALLEMRHANQSRPVDGWVFPAATRSGRVESVKSQHKRALKNSGVKPFVLYCARHTMLTRLGEAGADAFSIQKIAGHSSILISQRYVHPTPERIEGAFTLLEAYNSRKTKELSEEQKVQ